jgi:hypothetical protein
MRPQCTIAARHLVRCDAMNNITSTNGRRTQHWTTRRRVHRRRRAWHRRVLQACVTLTSWGVWRTHEGMKARRICARSCDVSRRMRDSEWRTAATPRAFVRSLVIVPSSAVRRGATDEEHDTRRCVAVRRSRDEDNDNHATTMDAISSASTRDAPSSHMRPVRASIGTARDGIHWAIFVSSQLDRFSRHTCTDGNGAGRVALPQSRIDTRK